MPQNEMVVYMQKQATVMNNMCKKHNMTEEQWIKLYSKKYREQYDALNVETFVVGKGWVKACQV